MRVEIGSVDEIAALFVSDGSANADLADRELEQWAPLSVEATEVVEAELREGRLTGRGLRRIRLVALTVADVADRPGALDAPLSVDAVRAALALRMPMTSVVGAP